jgi:predicted ATPase/DNA-binding CsgD family transcriptional regulator
MDDQPHVLIGREKELSALRSAAERALKGSGTLVLVSGEAGVGKTRLAEEAARATDAPVLRGGATIDATPAHGPIVAALRSRLRTEPHALDSVGPLRPHLALLLPELGESAPETDQQTIFEALRAALAAIGPAVVVLDDLHWSDDATLDLLVQLSESLDELPVFVVGLYRSDELTRGHSLRRARAELRRRGAPPEIALGPLDPEQTARLATAGLGGEPGPRLRRAIHERTQGVPFFVEEVSHALRLSGALTAHPEGLELGGEEALPVPETVRDAVLIRAGSLSPGAREAAEAAAVAGQRFPLALVDELSPRGGVSELLEHGLTRDAGEGTGEFRHALVREAIYEDVPWLRRRELHRLFAERLAAQEAPAREVAHHWHEAQETELARRSLMLAVDELKAVHAYRDAAAAGRVVLSLWDADAPIDDRLELLERYAGCAELAGELGEAARAWREAGEITRERGRTRELAEATRRLAGIYALQGDRVRATDAHRVSAQAFAEAGHAADAATDRLVAAGYLQRRGEHTEAEALAAEAEAEARSSGRLDLEAESLGLQGVARAKRGDVDRGLKLANAGLSLALDNGMTARAGSLYQCLGTVLESGARYGAARDAIESALGFCEASGEAGKERVCRECMAYLLRELGEWDRAVALATELTAEDDSAAGGVVANGIRGSILGFRGDTKAARPLLAEANETAIRLDLLSMQVDTSAALAYVAESEGDLDTANSHLRFLLQRWASSEDHHYAVWGLRWASSFFARHGNGEQARACGDALGRIAAGAGSAEALAALAHAIGEAAMLEGDASLAASQFSQALEIHRGLDIPFERAQVGLRAGTALAADGRRDPALAALAEAHRCASRLGAAPLMAAIAAEVAALGEPVEHALGTRAAARYEGAGLTRRELEVVRLVAEGHKNKEIAARLVLSTRTVDMHVRNILAKLECRTRVEAASKAAQLGLLENA